MTDLNREHDTTPLVHLKRRGFEVSVMPGMERELDLLLHEIFDKNPYTRHGISLSDGACVVDLGANMGLFSLWCTTQANNLNIYACEPLPPLYQLSSTNLAAIDGHQIHIDPRGIAAKNEVREMTFFPQATACSSVYGAQTVERMPALYSGAEVSLKDLWSIHKGAFFLGALWGPLFPFVRRVAISFLLRRALSVSQRYKCQMATLSTLLDEWQVDKIDLLKIDIQGSEVDAFQGLRPEHWEKIDSIAMEVNTFLGQSVDTDICSILERQGYRVIREDSSDITAPGSFFIYALRD